MARSVQGRWCAANREAVICEGWRKGQGSCICASSLGYWHFGHPHDVSKNAAMIAAKSSAATPDKTGVNWRIVAHSSLSEERWQRAPNLMVVASPPPTIWLYGHAPLGYFGRGIFSRGWLGDWLGAYDLEVAHGLGGMSGSGRGGGPAQLRHAKRGAVAPSDAKSCGTYHCPPIAKTARVAAAVVATTAAKSAAGSWAGVTTRSARMRTRTRRTRPPPLASGCRSQAPIHPALAGPFGASGREW